VVAAVAQAKKVVEQEPAVVEIAMVKTETHQAEHRAEEAAQMDRTVVVQAEIDPVQALVVADTEVVTLVANHQVTAEVAVEAAVAAVSPIQFLQERMVVTHPTETAHTMVEITEVQMDSQAV
jgi:hypothetical protein